MNDRTIIEPDKRDRTINFGMSYSLYKRIKLLAAKKDLSLGAMCRKLIEEAMRQNILK